MSDKKNPIDAYRKADVTTANKETILLMLYAGAIRFLNKAIDAMKADNKEEKSKYLTKTQDIVVELRATLDFSIGGQIAENLDSLYVFILESLLLGSLENNLTKLEEAQKILKTLHETWEQAIENVRKEKNSGEQNG
jgi:flagellar protein FliS